MEKKIDLSKEYGVVLEGGGAKGAYQIGVWKALKEAGVKIKGIAGVSVGALNGALICSNQLKKAEHIWENIDYTRVINADDKLLRVVKSKRLRDVKVSELVSQGIKLIRGRGLDITPLKILIEEVLDEEKIRNSSMELYIVTYSVSDKRGEIVDLKKESIESMREMLLASAYLPGFRSERLSGKRYMDGGSINNVPIDVLLDRGYEDILVIRIYGYGFDREKVVKIPKDVHVHHIAPCHNLGGVLEFDKRKSKRNLTLGYYDGLRFLYGLLGKFYYLHVTWTQEECLSELIRQLNWFEDVIKRSLPKEELPKEGELRDYFQVVFPKLAKALHLKEQWDYKDLYVGMLEEKARWGKINRFKIYTPKELIKEMKKLDIPFLL